ncbi:MAG: SH3 domain-containing protein, partial [Pseudolabrys sp.]
MPLKRTILFAAMTAAAVALSSYASAATIAAATTPLNIRSGPGPQYGIVGAIPARGQATVLGCIQGSLWCQVSFNGQQGWAYSQYLVATLAGRSLAVAETLQTLPAVTYQAPVETVDSTAPLPAVSGTLITPSAGGPLVISPPPAVSSYVISHPAAPVYLNG